MYMSPYPSNHLMDEKEIFICINEMSLQSESLPKMFDSTSIVVVNYFQTTDVTCIDTFKSRDECYMQDNSAHHMYILFPLFCYVLFCLTKCNFQLV